MTKQIRVRYAPSPTGHLHIGNARTALFNYLFARSQNGKFIIRIEDTDIKRNIPGGEESQLKYLKWLGIDWDESVDKGGEFGPYRQTERLPIYKKFAEELVARGLAYKCYCTEEELEKEREDQIIRGEMPIYSRKCYGLSEDERLELEKEGCKASIRIKVPENKITFDDIVKGEVSFEANGISDYIIIKQNGYPTYNYAVVVDDHLMKISHVLRGDDHVSNTPKQLIVYDAFGWERPIFGHMSLIVKESRKKLSKRDESIVQFIEQYKDLGYVPEALFNFIALLGWSPGGEQEIFSKSQLIEIFDPKRLSKAPAVFDSKKLEWISNHYIKNLEMDRLVDITLPHLIKEGFLNQSLTDSQKAWLYDLLQLYRDKSNYGAEIVNLIRVYFHEKVEYDDQAKEVLYEKGVLEVLQSFIRHVEIQESFEANDVQLIFKNVQLETKQKGKALFIPIRAAVTGQIHGPDLPIIIRLLGKDKILCRLNSFLNNLKQ